MSFDLVGKQPIVLLKTSEGNTFLPIWIGHPEAAAILMKLQGSDPPRPLTHDLACAIVHSLDAEIARVTVTELRENTFIARITLVQDGNEIEIDSRTSDAIALALRTDARIFAADDVIEESGVEFEGDEPDLGSLVADRCRPSLGDVDLGEFRRFLDSVSPDQFATRRRGRGRGRRRGRGRARRPTVPRAAGAPAQAAAARAPELGRVSARSSTISRSSPRARAARALASASASRRIALAAARRRAGDRARP